MEDIKTEVLTHREGTILQLTSMGFVALLVDKLDTSRPDDTEEFILSDVSDPDLPLVRVGARFQHKTGWRTGPWWKSRASWLEFEGSTLTW
jgi:hypothetical protein